MEIVNSEKIVGLFLIENGFVIANKDSQTSNGIDIVAIKNNKYYLIEVKTAIKDSRSYKVGKLEKSGKNSTHIAIVTPNKNIIFNSIEEHLKLCNNSGIRRVTSMVNFLDI